ncbi:MAG: hypothetical protein GY820_30335 [Gammaproteobacteria bacterium]|nr:hypothetical protein [Gammaproteobacteria bacterium]
MEILVEVKNRLFFCTLRFDFGETFGLGPPPPPPGGSRARAQLIPMSSRQRSSRARANVGARARGTYSYRHWEGGELRWGCRCFQVESVGGFLDCPVSPAGMSQSACGPLLLPFQLFHVHFQWGIGLGRNAEKLRSTTGEGIANAEETTTPK